ncbi:hypothetical protein [Corynebacterium sp. HMSC28B08]|uniref:hypothetical protein n=1 Tax=Corynebacterium TaxID=1716 RepID=UPI0008A34201|nr:hypothetical protein [Corynebacterium sp. HMSC28B08]OFT88716.1 hypothetical protein HMPREF3098_07805 [Corynebacterium sp. HMSC28B08]
MVKTNSYQQFLDDYLAEVAAAAVQFEDVLKEQTKALQRLNDEQRHDGDRAPHHNGDRAPRHDGDHSFGLAVERNGRPANVVSLDHRHEGTGARHRPNIFD